jgi:hypothetical protein
MGNSLQKERKKDSHTNGVEIQTIRRRPNHDDKLKKSRSDSTQTMPTLPITPIDNANLPGIHEMIILKVRVKKVHAIP